MRRKYVAEELSEQALPFEHGPLILASSEDLGMNGTDLKSRARDALNRLSRAIE